MVVYMCQNLQFTDKLLHSYLIHLCEFTQDELKWRLIEKQTNKPTKTNINFKILEIVHNFPFHSHLPGLCIPVGISPLPLYANILEGSKSQGHGVQTGSRPQVSPMKETWDLLVLHFLSFPDSVGPRHKYVTSMKLT